jgi:hypothetical protein
MQGHNGGSQWQQVQSRRTDQALCNLNEGVVCLNPSARDPPENLLILQWDRAENPYRGPQPPSLYIYLIRIFRR